MAQGDRPVGRLKYKSRDGTRYDVGTLWPGQRPDSHGLKPQKTTEAGQYPKMALSEAARRVESGDGFLDVWMETPARDERSSQRGSSRQQTSRVQGDDFDEF